MRYASLTHVKRDTDEQGPGSDLGAVYLPSRSSSHSHRVDGRVLGRVEDSSDRFRGIFAR